MSKSRPKVIITDETLRDGLQIERLGVTLEQKLKLSHKHWYGSRTY